MKTAPMRHDSVNAAWESANDELLTYG